MLVDQEVKNVVIPATVTTSDLDLTKPRFDDAKLQQVVQEMDNRRKNWLKEYKSKLDLNDVLEIRNP
jgi:hypothetical protein